MKTENEIKTKTIIINCKSIYQTYLFLSEYLATCKLNLFEFNIAKMEEEVLYKPSYIINGALACEYGLKFFLSYNDLTWEKPKGHDLCYLLNLLKDNNIDTYQLIIHSISKQFNGSQNETTIIANLKCFENIYNDYRYLWDKDSVGFNSIFPIFIETVCDIAIEMSNTLNWEDCFYAMVTKPQKLYRL